MALPLDPRMVAIHQLHIEARRLGAQKNEYLTRYKAEIARIDTRVSELWLEIEQGGLAPGEQGDLVTVSEKGTGRVLGHTRFPRRDPR